MKETHCQTILAYARSKPVGTPFKVSDFSRAVFTYEVGTRVGDLVRKWYLKKVGMDGKFAIYELNEDFVEPKKENAILGFLRRFFS